jgi:hypothetical protein
MSLYGYGLTKYVLESSLGVPTDCAEDNHDSWVTCTSSVECKTVITVVLTVMSGMDPHMIRWNLRWVWIGFGWDGLSK